MPKSALLGIARVDITADSTKFRQEWGKARKKVRSESNIITRSMKSVGLSGKGMGRAVRQGLTSFAGFAGIGVAVSLAVKGMVTQFSNLSRGVSEVSTLLGGMTDREMSDMRKELQGLAIDSGKSIEGLVKAKYDVISAGFTDAADSAKVMAAATDLAVAGVAEVSVTADVVTTALNAMNLAAADAVSVSNKIFETVRLGKTTVDEIAGSLGRVLAVAGPAGVSIDDVLGALAQLTAQGQSTEEANTAIRSSIVEIIKPGVQLSKIIRSIGFDSGRAAIEQVGYAKTLEMIAAEAKRAGIPMTDLFGNIRSLQAVLPLTGKGAEGFAASVKQVADATTSVSEGVDIMMDDVSVQFGRFTEAIKAIGSDIGEFIATPLSKVAGGIADLVLGDEGPKGLGKGDARADRRAAALENVNKKVAQLVKLQGELKDINDKLGDKFSLRRLSKEADIGRVTGQLKVMNAEFDKLVSMELRPGFSLLALSKLLKEIDPEEFKKFDPLRQAIADIAKEAKALEEAEEAAAEAAKKSFEASTEATKPSEDEKKAISEKIALIVKFNDEFAGLGKDRFDLERELLDQQVDAWEKAGIERTAIDKREADIRKQIALDEMMAKMQLAQDFLNGVAQIAGTFNQIEADRAAEKTIEEEESAQARFEIARRAIRQKNQEEGRLTKTGRQQIQKLEDDHRRNIDSIREEGIADQKKIGKKMQVIQIAQALMSAGLAVVNALATQPFIPVGLIAAGLAGGIGIANIAQIRAQKFAKGGVVGDDTFFSNEGNLAVAGEAGTEGIFPLGRTASGELGVKGAGGDAGAGLTLNFNGPLPEEFIEATIRRAEDMANDNQTTLVITRDFRESADGLEFGRTIG